MLVDGGVVTKNVNKKTRQKPYEPIDALSFTNLKIKVLFQLSMWNIVNHLGKHDFSFGQVINNLKGNFFLIKPIDITLT